MGVLIIVRALPFRVYRCCRRRAAAAAALLVNIIRPCGLQDTARGQLTPKNARHENDPQQQADDEDWYLADEIRTALLDT